MKPHAKSAHDGEGSAVGTIAAGHAAIDPLPKRASDGGPGHARCEAATPLLRMEQIDEFCGFGRDVGPQLSAARLGNARAGQDPQTESRRASVAGRLGDRLRDAVAPGRDRIEESAIDEGL